MNLQSYEGEKVEIVAPYGSFKGKVLDYIYADDNKPEKESIVVRVEDGHLEEFYEDSIESIKVI
jgi:hypothetical protein